MIKLSYSCSEDYSKMQNDGCSRFCDSCQTPVYDFRGKSEEEIREIVAEDPSIKCGAFTSSQAEEESRSKVNLIFRLAFAAVFVFGINTNVMFGQDQSKCEHPESIKIFKIEDSNTIKVTGRVIEYGNTPLVGAKVWYDNGDQRVAVLTNEQGEFSLGIADDLYGQEVTIQFSYPGYNNETFTINSAELKNYVLEVNMEGEEIFLGIMIMDD